MIPGPRRSSSDYESLLVMNEIMGGAFSSRINMNIREKNGYAYGASSWIRPLAYGGWIAAGAGVKTDSTAPAVREMVKEIGLMGEHAGEARRDPPGEVFACSRVSELV